MQSVRPNGRAAAVIGYGIAGCAAVLTIAACTRGGERGADSAAAPKPPAPSPYVGDIPAWPADTTTSSVDHVTGMPARLRARLGSCGADTPVVAADSVGPFYPGQPLANLFGACPHLLQLWRRVDGNAVPAIAFKLGDAVLLLDANGVIADAVVTRVAALEGARTAEGIGPGSPLADVQHAYGAPTWRREQCAVAAAFASHPGLVIDIAIPESGGDAYTCADIRHFASGTDFSHFPRGSTVATVAAELDENP
jgi:hypothetical protein